ncbi:hypothetical protein FB45DRAFT_907125 [Roridomyces roridus]|uniref:Uncharacterized protein n=1 Tax=Roridomyces roridus TaxID=1738132 RepID=A0AAD7FPX1_9AGAR|nr:hypothetical protein FB45DRAFT_907125 [Roridomyces roridus]
MLVSLETCGMVASFVVCKIGVGTAEDIFGPAFESFFILLAISMFLSVIFRTATMIRAKDRFFRQRFAFLGGCPTLGRPYTPVSIILNRSVDRPLVRGESTIIIMLRAVILSCVAVGLPIVAVYFIFLTPMRSQVYTRNIALKESLNVGFPSGQTTFVLEIFPLGPLLGWASPGYTVNKFSITTSASSVSHNCSVEDQADGPAFGSGTVQGFYVVWICPSEWDQFGARSRGQCGRESADREEFGLAHAGCAGRNGLTSAQCAHSGGQYLCAYY